jgi:hypothetical protein
MRPEWIGLAQGVTHQPMALRTKCQYSNGLARA